MVGIYQLVLLLEKRKLKEEENKMEYFFGFIALICIIGALTMLLTND